MKKFRILALVLAMAIVLCVLSGCGEKADNKDNNAGGNSTVQNEQQDNTTSGMQDNSTTDASANSNPKSITTKQEFSSVVGSLVDLTKYNDLSENSQTYSYTLKSENKKEYDLDYSIKLGDDTKFTMPITIKDMESKGWKIKYSSDQEISPGYMTWEVLENDSGKNIRVSVYNATDKKTTTQGCTVIGFESTQYDIHDLSSKVKSAEDFTVCDSLTQASTFEDIVKRLGEPTSIHCSIREADGKFDYSKITVEYSQKSSAYSYIHFELSGADDRIALVKYEVKPN